MWGIYDSSTPYRSFSFVSIDVLYQEDPIYPRNVPTFWSRNVSTNIFPPSFVLSADQPDKEKHFIGMKQLFFHDNDNDLADILSENIIFRWFVLTDLFKRTIQ